MMAYNRSTARCCRDGAQNKCVPLPVKSRISGLQSMTVSISGPLCLPIGRVCDNLRNDPDASISPAA